MGSAINFCVEHRRSGAQRRSDMWPNARSICFRQAIARHVQSRTGWVASVCDPDVIVVVSIHKATVAREGRSEWVRTRGLHHRVTFGLKLPQTFTDGAPESVVDETMRRLARLSRLDDETKERLATLHEQFRDSEHQKKNTEGLADEAKSRLATLYEQFRDSERQKKNTERQLEQVQRDTERQLEQVQRDTERKVEQVQRELAWSRVAVLPYPLEGNEPFRLDRLFPDDEVFKLFAGLMQDTAAEHRQHLHTDVVCSHPVLLISRIDIITNAHLIKLYYMKMGELQRLRRKDCTTIPSLLHLKLGRRDGCCSAVTDLNEHFLFHACPAEAITSVLNAGFDPRRGGESVGEMFGAATYFAVNCSKADIYSESFERRIPKHSDRKLIVARVLLGDSHRTAVKMPTATRPPDDTDGQPKDSVWADARSCGGAVDHIEAMVYDKGQAYPRVLVTYRHCITCRCAECHNRPIL